MRYVYLLTLMFPICVHAEGYHPVLLNGKIIFKIQKLHSEKCDDWGWRVATAATRMAQEEFDKCMSNHPMGKVTESNRPQMSDMCLIKYEAEFKLAHKTVMEEKLKKEGCESKVSQ